jgi:hypothetical protein
MSDSEGDASIPDDSQIEGTLRAIIARIYKSGHHDDLTVKRVRTAAEEQIDLPEGFFKQSSDWNERSKTVITDEVVRLISLPILQEQVIDAAGRLDMTTKKSE